MESPNKKRKLNVGVSLNRHPKATSTPQIDSQNGWTPAAFSSSSELSNLSAYSPSRNSIFQPPGSSGPEPLDITSSSFAELSIEDNDEQCTDYEAFLLKCRRIQRKGLAWNSYKPTRDDEGCLYHQILFNPKGFSELASWFAQYCKTNESTFGIFALYRFYFDCAGFQTFDLKKYLTFPVSLDKLCSNLKKDTFISLLKTKKFLLNDKQKLAQVFKYSIYSFIEKFVLEAHKEGILDGEVFKNFLLLLYHVSMDSVYKPLLFTSYMFVAKILTTLCKLKVELLKNGVMNSRLIDNYIKLLYGTFSKLPFLGANLPSLKIFCIRELMIWVELSAKLFLGGLKCTNLLKELSVDQMSIVRLNVLDTCIKLIENEECHSYLKGSSMEMLIHSIWGRVQDVKVEVQLRALDVLDVIAKVLPKSIRKKSFIDQLMETMYNKDYRIGSGAGKCVMKILNYNNDSDMVILIQLSEISQGFHPKLASALVESCISHTNILQNWALIINALCNQSESSKMTHLSNLLYESVYITLRGKPRKVRRFSIQDRLVQTGENASIAAELYPNLKTLVALYAPNQMIIANIFKVLIEIDHTSLSEDHYEIINDLVQHSPTFFNKWENLETLKAILSYLNYISKYFPNCSNCVNAINILKTCISKRFKNSLNENKEDLLFIAQKTAVICEAFDLNESLEWTILISAQKLDNVNARFLETIWTICHWCLMWRVKKLTAAEVPPYWQMAMELFANCIDVMKLDNLSLQFKAFERICETSVSICIEMKTFNAELPALQDEMQSFKNSSLLADLMKFFHDNVEPSSVDNVKRFQKYIFLLYQMATLNIIPMEYISTIFKYLGKYYAFYGEIIEALLIQISEKNKNWLSQLVLRSIILLVVGDVRSKVSTNNVTSLVRRFYNVKQIACPEVTGKLLMFAVNYAAATRFYDLLSCVTIFISKLVAAPDVCNEVLKTIETKVPNEDKNSSPILAFVKALRDTAKLKTPISARKLYMEQRKKATEGKAKTPNTKPQTQKGKRLFVATASECSSENQVLDVMSNIDPDFAALRIID